MNKLYKRFIDLQKVAVKRSFFLFGARQTGKSTLLKETFPEARYIDLLDSITFREYSARPELLRERLTEKDSIIIIDEVQKLPGILDEVHLLMERNKNLRFILTGSSARKLKGGGANLLGGRAWTLRLHPLISAELDYDRLNDRINFGSLPSIIDSEYKSKDLQSYVGSYLKEEIRAEGLSRSIEDFSRFLEVAGLTNGKQINYTEAGSDAQVSPRVIREYYSILEDTLVGFTLNPYQKLIKRKPVSSGKFYLFDTGVSNVLSKSGNIEEGSNQYGGALEHLIFLELRAFIDYNLLDMPLHFWRTTSLLEVDFLVDGKIAIEVKAGRSASKRDYKHLLSLREDIRLDRMILVCNEKEPRKTSEGVEIMPVNEFLKALWANQIIRN